MRFLVEIGVHILYNDFVRETNVNVGRNPLFNVRQIPPCVIMNVSYF